jgi:hypothetical protein
MLPMERNVRISSSATIWAADLHRCTCEWEVRALAVLLCNCAITIYAVRLDLIRMRPTPTISIMNTTTVHCRTVWRSQDKTAALHTVTSRMRHTVALRHSQVSAHLLELFHLSLFCFPCVVRLFQDLVLLVPIIISAPCSWTQVLAVGVDCVLTHD